MPEKIRVVTQWFPLQRGKRANQEAFRCIPGRGSGKLPSPEYGIE